MYLSSILAVLDHNYNTENNKIGDKKVFKISSKIHNKVFINSQRQTDGKNGQS